MIVTHMIEHAKIAKRPLEELQSSFIALGAIVLLEPRAVFQPQQFVSLEQSSREMQTKALYGAIQLTTRTQIVYRPDICPAI